MSKLAVSQTPTTVTVVDQTTAKVYTITNTQPNWVPLVEALKGEDNDEEILQLISVKSTIEHFSPVGEIEVNGNNVTYRGAILEGLDVDHLLEAIRTGNKRQAKALTLFLQNKQLNPSYQAVRDMYKFRQNRGMPLTDDGCFLAYKGVMKDYWSRNANPKTIVLSGQVNESGQILNTVGSYIEVDRKCVEDDPAKGCGEGLHAGSLEYASGWGEKVIIVKIHPKDVVSVPTSEDNKMRVCAYTVVGECQGIMPEHFDKKLDEPEFDDSDEEPEDESCDDDLCRDCGELLDSDGRCERCDSPDDRDDESYNDGYEKGLKDGKAKVKRQYYDGDEDNGADGYNDYMAGYNEGYRKGRYHK